MNVENIARQVKSDLVKLLMSITVHINKNYTGDVGF